jgi:hypothetical protein
MSARRTLAFMRFEVVTLLTLTALGCADEGSKPGPTTTKCVQDGNPAACEISALEPDANACALGQSMHSATLSALKVASPLCSNDADCVARSTAIDCRGVVRINLCDDVMHRDAASRWNPDQLCARILERTPDNGLSCAIEAACAAPSLARCRGGECVRAHL